MMDMQKENSELQNLINEMHDVTGTWSVADMVAHVWQAAKYSAVPDGFILVEKKDIEHWYLDEGEYMWMEEPDDWLCDLDIGEVQKVEHKEYVVTNSSPLFAAKVWDDENKDVDSWHFFKTEEEAKEAAAYCKAMIEAAQEQGHV